MEYWSMLKLWWKQLSIAWGFPLGFLFTSNQQKLLYITKPQTFTVSWRKNSCINKIVYFCRTIFTVLYCELPKHSTVVFTMNKQHRILYQYLLPVYQHFVESKSEIRMLRRYRRHYVEYWTLSKSWCKQLSIAWGFPLGFFFTSNQRKLLLYIT